MKVVSLIQPVAGEILRGRRWVLPMLGGIDLHERVLITAGGCVQRTTRKIGALGAEWKLGAIGTVFLHGSVTGDELVAFQENRREDLSTETTMRLSRIASELLSVFGQRDIWDGVNISTMCDYWLFSSPRIFLSPIQLIDANLDDVESIDPFAVSP